MFLTLAVGTVFSVAGCERRRSDTGTVGDTVARYDTMLRSDTMLRADTMLRQNDTNLARDTSWAPGDTAPRSVRGNQTESGVTDTRTGKSTLGPGVTKTRPDQNQPVTSKGDTIRSGSDTTGR
jgi:hypothetical protein